MADVSSTLAAWSSTTASNAPSGSTTIGTGLDDNLREIQGVIVRGLSHKGSDIASVAGTTDIGAVEGLMHDITGALAITGLGTVRAGILKVLKFEGAATLTHNATSLILPGAANIVCADGDVGVFISEGSGNWRCLHFMRTSHLPSLPAGTWTLINTYAPSAAASQAVTGFSSSLYTDYKIVIDRLVPANDGVSPYMRSSTDGGSNYDSGASDYAWGVVYSGAGFGGGGNNNDDADSKIDLTAAIGIGSATGEFLSGEIFIPNPAAAAYFACSGTLVGTTAAGVNYVCTFAGKRLTAADVDAVQFLFSSGNIASGTIRFYGLRK